MTPANFVMLADAAFYLVYAKLVLQETIGASTIIPSDDLDSNRRCGKTQTVCSDPLCKGVNGVCTQGDQAGCICNAAECPPDDRLPSCSNCGGDDGSTNCIGVSVFNLTRILRVFD